MLIIILIIILVNCQLFSSMAYSLRSRQQCARHPLSCLLASIFAVIIFCFRCSIGRVVTACWDLICVSLMAHNVTPISVLRRLLLHPGPGSAPALESPAPGNPATKTSGSLNSLGDTQANSVLPSVPQRVSFSGVCKGTHPSFPCFSAPRTPFVSPVLFSSLTVYVIKILITIVLVGVWRENNEMHALNLRSEPKFPTDSKEECL